MNYLHNKIFLTTFSALTLAISGLSVSNAQESQAATPFIDGESQSADDFIKALKPKPRYKTRGIRFNNQNPEASPEPKAPTIAMGINFEYDSDALSEHAITQLQPLGEALNSDELLSFSFKIDGHTDASGSEEYNMDLSRRRALSVGRHLYETYGVNIDRLKLNGKGEAELYDPQKPTSGINRRVEITTLVQ